MTEINIIRNAVSSSNIHSAGYDTPSQIMEVKFNNGNIYRYKAVPEILWGEFCLSFSKGAFLAREIKGKYEVEVYVDDQIKLENSI